MLEPRDIEIFSEIVSKTIAPIREDLADKFSNLERNVQNLDGKVLSLHENFYNLEWQVRSIKLSIENEINPKICIIAEGHSDLNRKLDKCIGYVLSVHNEKEQSRLRTIYLESEITKIKDRLDAFTHIS